MFTVIPISNFSKSIFDQVTPAQIKQLQKASSCYIVNSYIFNQLQNVTFPINNKKGIKNVLEFLEYLDMKILDSRDGRIEIPKDVFENYFTSIHYTKYQEILYKLKIIAVTLHDDGTLYTTNYIGKTEPGVKQLKPKCKIYRVGFDYLNNKTLAMVIPHERKTEIKVDNRIKGIDKRFVKTIKTVAINLLPAVEDEIAEYRRGKITFNQLKSRLSRVLQLKRIKFIKKGTNVNRVYHSLSNISKVSRKHLDIPFYFIDVKNCQPLLLCALMVKDNHMFDDAYQLDCENAVFYDRFKGFGANKIDTKKLLYRHVFFGFKPHEKINQKFKEIYPNTWEYLYDVSKTKESLASKLQNLESELFNVLIPNKSRHFFTLFDAIYFDRIDDAGAITITIQDFFGELGLKVQVDFDKN